MDRALSIRHILNLPDAASVSDDQRWVLSAMIRHGDGLIRTLWRILGNESDVCDAYQETFLKLAGSSAEPAKKSIKAYVYKTASNAAIDILRKKRSNKTLHENFAQNENFNSENVARTSEFDMEQLISELRSRVGMLPDCLQQVVMLRDFGELPYRQVADIMGITPETARVYRRRAVIMLSELMENCE